MNMWRNQSLDQAKGIRFNETHHVGNTLCGSHSKMQHPTGSCLESCLPFGLKLNHLEQATRKKQFAPMIMQYRNRRQCIANDVRVGPHWQSDSLWLNVSQTKKSVTSLKSKRDRASFVMNIHVDSSVWVGFGGRMRKKTWACKPMS